MVINGRYDIVQNGTLIGHERFRLRGHAIETERELSWPAPSHQRTRIVIDPMRDPEEVEIDLTWSERQTVGRYRIDRKAAQLRSVVRPQTGASIERLVAFDETTEIDSSSPLFCFVTVGRLRLRPGERRDVPVVRVQVPTLLPELVRLRYRRLGDVEIPTPGAGSLLAAEYTVEMLGAEQAETRFQANLLGLPLRMTMRLGEGVCEYVLVE